MINSDLIILEVKSSFYNKYTNRKKHHDTDNKKDIKKDFTAIHSRLFTLLWRKAEGTVWKVISGPDVNNTDNT